MFCCQPLLLGLAKFKGQKHRNYATQAPGLFFLFTLLLLLLFGIFFLLLVFLLSP